MLPLVKKKQKGNTMLLLIMVTMVLVVVGTVVSSAVMNSTNSHVYKKINNDLYYAAESGLDLGQSKIVNDATIAQGIVTAGGVDVHVVTLNDFDTDIESVKVTGKKISNTEIELTSIAKKRNSTKELELSGIIKKGGVSINSLYEYSLASKELEVVLCGGVGTPPNYNDGSMDFRVTKLAYQSNLNLEIWKLGTPNIRETVLPPVKTESITLNIPSMRTTPHVARVDIEVQHGGTINSALDNKSITDGVKKETLIFNRGAYNDILNIYTINADKLYINNDGVYESSGLVNSIIICNGEVIVAEEKPNINPSSEYHDYKNRIRFSETLFKYEKATIIANKLTVYGANFQAAYPLLVKDNSGNITADSILRTDEEVELLNGKLEEEMPGWTSAGGGVSGGSGEWGMVENTQYK